MSHALNIHDGLGIIAKDPAAGILLAYGNTVPANGAPGYAPGCRFSKTNGTSVGTVEYVNIGTKLSANFQAGGLSAAVAVNYIYGEVTLFDSQMFTADRPYIAKSIIVNPLVVGSDGGAVTAQVKKVANGLALSAGTALHSGTIDLKGTIYTNQVMTMLDDTTCSIATGESIGVDATGTTTAARGVISIIMLPL